MMRDAARRLLLRLAGDDPTIDRVIEVTTSTLAALCQRLAALVGDSGVSAVLDRAFKEHGFAGGGTRWTDQVAHVPGFVHGREAGAAEAAADLLASFVGMISTFIGEPLTQRLLHDLWPDAFVRDEP